MVPEITLRELALFEEMIQNIKESRSYGHFKGVWESSMKGKVQPWYGHDVAAILLIAKARFGRRFYSLFDLYWHVVGEEET